MLRSSAASCALCAGLLLAACREEASPPRRAEQPTLEISGPRDQVGFDAEVRLRAELRGGSTSERWTIRWEQLFGPPPRRLLQQGNELTLVTPAPPSPAQAQHSLGQILPLGARAAGRMVFRAIATAPGRSLSQLVEVIPALPTAGWPRIARGAIVYLPVEATASRSKERAAWQVLEGKLDLDASQASYLDHARGREVAWSRLRSPAGKTLHLRGGLWLGDQDCSRVDCHPREARGWSGTAHASILARGLSGELARTRGPYQAYCIACHTVGYQPTCDNEGFASVAERLHWQFPTALTPASWRELPPPLRERANVQCESCHGPGWFYTGYGDDICAQCHDHPPQYRTVEQGLRNRMHEAEQSVSSAESTAPCPQCHVGAAYLESLRGHRSTSRPELEVETTPRGVTCPICHDPHGPGCRRQLRLCGYVEVPGRTFAAGQGALCISCHNNETDVARVRPLRPFVPGRPRVSGTVHGGGAASDEQRAGAAPHAPQFQVLTARGAKFLRAPDPPLPPVLSPHLQVPDSCVGCHYHRDARHRAAAGHTFKLLDDPRPEARRTCFSQFDVAALKRARATAACAKCHGALATLNVRARGDYDGDGAVRGILEEIEGLMALLRAELGQQISAQSYPDGAGRRGVTFTVVDEQLVVADERCQPLRGPGGRPLALSAAMLVKAAYNYVLVVRDGSGGIHNPPYVVRMLQHTLSELERARGAAVKHAWRQP